jgi:hypothetical protein
MGDRIWAGKRAGGGERKRKREREGVGLGSKL